MIPGRNNDYLKIRASAPLFEFVRTEMEGRKLLFFVTLIRKATLKNKASATVHASIIQLSTWR